MKRLLLALALVTFTAISSRASIQVETTATVEDSDSAGSAVVDLQNSVSSGGVSLGGFECLAISDPVYLISTGPGISLIAPNVGEAGALTTVIITGDSFVADTLILLNGNTLTPEYISATKLRLVTDAMSSSVQGSSAMSSSVIFTAVDGSSSQTLYQYDPQMLIVTKCFPLAGTQVGGYGGGGLVNVTVAGWASFDDLPTVDLTAVRCRFGPLLVVTPEEEPLERGVIQCLPAASSTAGEVTVSISVNSGQHWLASTTKYTYFCNQLDNYIDPEGSGSCLPCPKGGLCNGGPNYYPKDDYWRAESRPLNSQIYPCHFKGSCIGAQEPLEKGGSVSSPKCLFGYTGAICAVCDTDQYLTATGCLPCSDAAETTIIVGIILVALVLVVIGIWLFFSYNAAHNLALMRASSALLSMDRNNDGVIDAAEYIAAGGTQEDFDFYDKTKDGLLDASEMQERALDEVLDGLEDNMPCDFTVNDATSLFPTDIADTSNADNQTMLDGYTGKTKSAFGVGSSNSIVPVQLKEVSDIAALESAGETISQMWDVLSETLWASMGQLKILFGVFQIVSTFLGTFTVEWPSIFEDFTGYIQFVNFGVFDVDSLTCSSPEQNFYDKMLMQVFGPIGLVLLLAGVAWLRIRHAVGKYGVAKAAKKKIMIENQHMFAFLFLLFVLYAGVSTTIMKFFKCTEIDGVWLLDADYRLQCFETEWMSYLPLAFLGIALYPLGIPAFTLVGLLLHMDSLHYDVEEIKFDLERAQHDEALLLQVIVGVEGLPEASIVQQSVEAAALVKSLDYKLEQAKIQLPTHKNVLFKYGFIYAQYQPEAWYWEQVLMLHKFLLTSVIIFVQPGTTAQLAAAFLINLIFLLMHVQTQAFMTPEENTAQFTGLISILLTIFSGIVINYDNLAEETDVYNTIITTGVVMGAQIAVVLMFAMGVGSAGQKSMGVLDKMKKEAIKAAQSATEDALHEQLQSGLDDLAVYVRQMVDEEEMEPDIGEVCIALVEQCHDMEIKEKKSIVHDLTVAMGAGLAEFTEQVFDLAIWVLIENERVMGILIKIACTKVRDMLKEIGTSPLFIELVSSAIMMAPRVARSFDTIKSKLEKLASNACRCQNGEGDDDTLQILMDICLEICGGKSGLQRITDQAFRYVRDELAELGVPEVGLCLLPPIGTAAISTLFDELEWHSLDPAEQSKASKEFENQVDFCSVILKLSALTGDKLLELANDTARDFLDAGSRVEVELEEMTCTKNVLSDVLYSDYQIPKSFDEAQQLAMDIITKAGMDKFTELTGLTAVPQTDDEFTAMCASMALKMACKAVNLEGTLEKLEEVKGEVWSAAFDLLVETGELVLGKLPVGLLMEAACISMVATCTALPDHAVTSVMAAVTQGCREAPARVCMELQKALIGEPEQQRQNLEKIESSYLGSSRLSLLRDPKFTKSCSELQSEFPNSIGNTANRALAKAISENAGSFVLENGVLAFTNACDELRQASGSGNSREVMLLKLAQEVFGEKRVNAKLQESIRASTEQVAYLLREQSVAPQYLAVFRAGMQVLVDSDSSDGTIYGTQWDQLSQFLSLLEANPNEEGIIQAATPLIEKVGVAFLTYAPVAEELQILEQRLKSAESTWRPSTPVTKFDNGTDVGITCTDAGAQSAMVRGLIELSMGFVLERGPDRLVEHMRSIQTLEDLREAWALITGSEAPAPDTPVFEEPQECVAWAPLQKEAQQPATTHQTGFQAQQQRKQEMLQAQQQRKQEMQLLKLAQEVFGGKKDAKHQASLRASADELECLLRKQSVAPQYLEVLRAISSCLGELPTPFEEEAQHPATTHQTAQVELPGTPD